jgi:hypothetical protein
LTPADILYFGCVNDRNSTGHALYGALAADVRIQNAYDMSRWLDNLAPRDGRKLHQPQGQARYYQRDGWSVVDWWDRSVDHRGDSHSSFLARGDWTAAELLAAGAIRWPDVWARQPVPVGVPT